MVLIKISKVSIYELLQDLNINRKINNFCCIFRIYENYTQAIFLYQNKEIEQAGKCFSNILQEASIYDLETQLSFIEQNSRDKFRKFVSDAQSNLHNFYIQNTIDEADNLFKKAVVNNKLLDLNILKQSLDTYNLAIQLNKIEKKNNQDEIIDKYKYDYCLYKKNEILIYNLGEKNEKIKKLLEELQEKLKIKMIKNKNPNLINDLEKTMNNINNDIKNTAKAAIKLILRDSPYPDYNGEYEDSKIDEIFNKGDAEIKRFIRKLKTKYLPDRFDRNMGEQHLLAQRITAHLNDIFDRINNN